jgi:AraC-like DNA-binding protein
MMIALHQVRAVALTGYVEVARFVGLDPFAMLKRANIRPALLDDPETRLPAAPVADLLEESARMSGCQSFGLLMAECRTFESLGPVALLLQHLGCLREVLKAAVQYRRQLNDVFDLSLSEAAGTALVEVSILPQFAGRQVVDQTMAMTHLLLGGASRWACRPRVVHFRQGPPDDLRIYNRFFPVRVEFDSSFDGLEWGSSELDRRWPWANELMAQHAERLLDQLNPKPAERPVSEAVARSIALLMPAGRASLDGVAAALDSSPRILQRSLEKEGKSFGDLLTSARRELAVRYLSNHSQSISSVAELTGYASSSSFTRWFGAEAGLSPRMWRESRDSRAA